MQPYKRFDSFSFSTPLEKTGEGRPGYMTFQNGAEEIVSHLSVGSVLGAGDICLVNVRICTVTTTTAVVLVTK
ncbi:hypothetical protein BaRGS_00018008 [Batillaria attramentaria]|uniref:Uncharacterized protein n=1 Tax=Batillaria attramentaria TaxID=370345 RepID=A0ABD0KV53_9CAEN